jgi:dolichol-phosphate mannosyltransferase
MSAPELAVVIPTFNESKNVGPLIELLKETLNGISWEAIFVDDDSKDGTGETLIKIGQTDPRIRCLRRIGRRGLSSACIEGMMATGAPYIAVMDADLQHDHTLLPKMLAELKNTNAELVVGSRYMEGGSLGNWNAARRLVSKVATKFGQLILRMNLTDPMSGFFMLRRSFFEKVVRKLTGKGFKILVDIVSSAPKGTPFSELPFTFRTRHEGESKLGTLVISDYLFLVAEKSLGKIIPVRFAMFVLVGTVGAVFHIFTLGLLMRTLELSFSRAQAIATLIAMTVNFTLNNLFSYRDQQLRGLRFLQGLVTFYFACAVGAFINLMIARSLYGAGVIWWLSGLLGAMVGAVWNFAITSTFTWTRSREKN